MTEIESGPFPDTVNGPSPAPRDFLRKLNCCCLNMVKFEDLSVSNRSCIEVCDIPGCEHVLHLVKPPLQAAKHSTAVLGGGQRRPRPDIQG